MLYSYGPRLIDVDVLFYGDAVVTTETVDGQLIVPHERIHERDFVLAPFCDIAPGERCHYCEFLTLTS